MILVTGGAGYIGSHCAMALLEKGYDVIIIDSLELGHVEVIDVLKSIYGDSRISFIEGNIKNTDNLNAIFDNNKIDAVIHFAAYSQVLESTVDPKKYYDNNVVGTINLLRCMVDHSVDKIVFSSSAAVYGEPISLPITENHPCDPINPYGKTKLIIEKIMDDYSLSYSLKSVRLRYFNVIGADSLIRLGESHNPETHLVPNIIKSMLNEDAHFRIFGDDYETKDGTCVRDYVNVEDLAGAHISALEYLFNGGKTDYFNIGSGCGYSIKEILNACEEVTGHAVYSTVCSRRHGDPAVLVASIEKAKQLLHWAPKKSLSDSVKSAYMWERKIQERL